MTTIKTPSLGYTSVTLHLLDRSVRVKFDPNDPEAVVQAMEKLVLEQVTKVVVSNKPDPRYAEWQEAVAAGATLASYEEFIGVKGE